MRRVFCFALFWGLLSNAIADTSEDVRLLKESNALLIKKLFQLESDLKAIHTTSTDLEIEKEVRVIAAPPSEDRLPSWLEDAQIDASIRHRWESMRLNDFPGKRFSNTSFIGQRARLGLETQIRPGARLEARLIDTREWGDQNSASRQNNTYFELLNLSFDDWIHGSEVIVGRQKLHFGDGSLLGWEEWDNRGQFFDGIRISRRFKDGESLDAFYTKPTAGNAAMIHQDDVDLAGLWGHFRADENMDLDLFWLHNRNAQTDLSLSTYGVGLNFRDNRIEADATAAWHDGELGTVDQGGDMLRVGLDYHTRSRHQHDFRVAYNRASGSSGFTNTFRPLYGALHETAGIQDIFAFQNVNETQIQATWRPQSDSRMRLKLADLKMDDTGDSIYSSSGGILGRYAAAITNRSRDIGQEMSLRYEKQWREDLAIFSGYAYLNGGDATRTLVPEADGAQWFYMGSNLMF